MYLYGVHTCASALAHKKRNIAVVYISGYDVLKAKEFSHYLPPLKPKQEVIDHILRFGKKIPVKKIDKNQIKAMLGEDTVHQGIVLDVEPLPFVDLSDLYKPQDKNSIIVVLDHVSDPHNIGAILRSCAVFGVSGVVLTSRHSPKESALIAKIASGGLDLVPLCYVANLAQAIDKLKEDGFWTIGLAESTDKTLNDIDMKGRIAIIMGSEGDGMRRLTQSKCDFKAKLLTASTMTTLNVSQATTLALAEAYRQQLSNQ